MNIVCLLIKVLKQGDGDIPAVVYKSIVCQSKYALLEYRHKSGKLYACCVCKSFKSPKEFNIQFHVGKLE